MYSMYYTRPDIDFSIWKLSRYTSKPNTDHWKAIAKVFGYLKRTIDLDLFYFDSLVVWKDIMIQVRELVWVIISPH